MFSRREVLAGLGVMVSGAALAQSLSFRIGASGTATVPNPPFGFVYLVNASGAFILNADGAYIICPV